MVSQLFFTINQIMSQQLTSTEMANSMKETRRRQKATVTGGESTLDDNSGYTRDFQAADQKFILWNMANRKTRPHTHKPAFRLLGLFPDMATTLSHAEQVFAIDNTCSLHASTTHEWYSIPVDADVPTQDMQAKVNRNLLRHQNVLQSHASEFKERHDALTHGRTPAVKQAKGAQEQVARDDEQRMKHKEMLEAVVDNDTLLAMRQQYAEEEVERQTVQALGECKDMEEGGVVECKDMEEEGECKDTEYVETPLMSPVAPETLNETWDEDVAKFGSGKRPPAVSRMVEVRNQRYAVVSVVCDYETAVEGDPMGDEPGVIVWAAFESEEEALKYNKVVASKELRDHDLAIVSMYEWLYPHMMASDKVEQMYRNEELNNIMKHSRTASTRVRQFEDMCQREGVDAPAIELEPDLCEPAPRKWEPPIGSELDSQQFVHE